MSCEEVENALEYRGLDGLTPELQRHVARCAHCQSLVEALDTLEQSLRALPVPPVRARRGETALSELDAADVIAERRAEARIDWYRTIQQVELTPRRHFGVPRVVPRGRRSWGQRLALGALAAAVLVSVGLVAAVIWNDLRSEAPTPANTFVGGESGEPVDALDRR